MLAGHFVDKHAARLGKDVQGISPEALKLLSAYRWPGNVRELENAIERAVVLGRGPRLQPTDLPPELHGTTPTLDEPEQAEELPPLVDAKERFVAQYLTRVIALSEGNLAEAARRAGIDRSNFRRLARRHGLA